MRAYEFEARGAVIEFGQVVPRGDGVTRSASEYLAVAAKFGHAIRELTAMRILVAGRTY